MERMILRNIQPKDLVEGNSYLVCKTENTRECFLAVWTGKVWITDGERDHNKDWPDAVFENPYRAKVTESLTLDEYQEHAKSTAVYPNIGKNVIYPTLGLCGETGEFAEKVKKAIRDDGGEITEERKTQMVKELGDVMWYLATIASELNVSLGDIARLNVEKLASRKQRDALHGSGDNR